MRLQIKDIIPNPANPRVIRDEQFRKLKQSLAQFPQMLEKRPIAVTKEGGKYIALGGNQRLRALLDLKQEIGDADFEQRYTAGAAEMETLLGYFSKGVPVVDCTELTPMQQKRFIIADNVPFGEWDWEGLANEWDVEELADWGLNVPGWEPTEDESEKASDEELDESAESAEEIQTDIKLGDLFEIGPHRLLCGDSTNIENVQKLLNGKSIDMIFTDPMYQDSPKPIINIFDAIDTKYFVIMATFKQCISFIVDSGYNFRFDLVLNQKVPSSSMNKKVPYYLHKNIIYLTKDDTTIFNCDNAIGVFSDAGYYPSIIESAKNTSEAHGLTKNSEGIKKILSGFKFSSVLDLFMGSGSTMAAAHLMKRTCYGMELDPRYCQIIINRMAALDPNLQITKNGQPYATTNTTTEGE